MMENAPTDAVRLGIRAKDLCAKLESRERLEFLDVRSEPEFRALHIPGAKLATRALVDELFASWPKDTPIILCDHFGGSALDAARTLEGRGFTAVRALIGGIDAWSREIDPLMPRYP
ncbi:MAG: rhodanese-like domain-containing protein [Elusimicrobiota bacterium]|jgi:rhodanese-related sulfurtransferase